MMLINPVFSPDGEKIAFWGCQGNRANGCLVGEDLDIWVVHGDGSNLTNLTEDSPFNDSHPDWSPAGDQIVVDSDRMGKKEIYLMKTDGSGVQQLTNGLEYNSEPKWSSDVKWIAYHSLLEGDTQIRVISTDGQSAGEGINGNTPAWSPGSTAEGMRLAFLCVHESHSDICTADAEGSTVINLTNSPVDEHSPAWSPDGS